MKQLPAISYKQSADAKDRLDAATPGPWQRGYFVDHRRYRDMPEEWKEERREAESRTIRGPGEVGTPGCNVVLRIQQAANPADIDFIAHAWEDINNLLTIVASYRQWLTEYYDKSMTLQAELDEVTGENKTLKAGLTLANIIIEELDPTDGNSTTD